MSKKYAFLFPGQGAQYPGMARDFYDAFAVARRTFEEADSCLGSPFSRLIFEGPASELTLTKNSQIAIYIASIAILRTVQELFPDIQPAFCAGLSLGEYTALTAAGQISFVDGLQLVRARARYMHEACEMTQGTMFVVLGLEPETISEILRGLNIQVGVANVNCPGQVVIAGATTEMPKAVDALKQQGAKRVLPLEVSGAFHSPLMRCAQEKLAPEIRAVPLVSSATSLVMNVPGGIVSELSSVRQCLIDQVATPVFWEKGVRAMMAEQVEIYLEMGPGKTLAGMNKRIGVTQPTWSIEKVSDLEAIQGALCSY